MHRVSALLPSWDRSRQTAGPAPRAPGALDKVFGWAEKIVVPVKGSSASTTPTAPARYGRETYWPTTLDKECDKAARILKSFCFDGFLSQLTEQTEQSETSAAEPPATPAFVTKKIPPRIIQNAVGLAVFSCMRSGLWMSGSGGAGLITARKADGTWSPPSGIILHTAELAFVMGVDIYDCVLVINSVQVLELFTRPRLILGADVSLSVGPLVADGAKEPEIRWKEISETVLTYVKARGKHQAVQLDGSMVTERSNENERFYRAGVTVLDVLAGNIPKNIPEMRPLFEVIKAAEGRSDYDKTLMDWLAQQPAPGDAELETPTVPVASPPKTAFGLPDADDPDPFGVIGLEMAGIEIREAGSQLRPNSTQFEYNPSPTSPVYGRFSRQSMDTFVSRSNRGSCMSARTQTTAMTDAYTQTDVASTADTSFSRANSDDGKDCVEKLPTVVEPEEVDYTLVDTSIIEKLKRRASEVPTVQESTQATHIKEVKATTEVVGTKEKQPEATAEPESPIEPPTPQTTSERDEDADDEDDEECEDEEEPVICEVAMAAAQPTRTSIQKSQVTQVIQAKGAIVTIPKRIPPPLPARSPARASRGSKSDYGDVSSLRSPVRNSFLSIESRVDDAIERVSIDTTISAEQAQEPSTTADQDSQNSLMQRPASPRHQKNSSSVCTAVAVDSPTPDPTPVPASAPETEFELFETPQEKSHVSPLPSPSPSSSPAVSPTPQTLEPTSASGASSLSSSSSAEDESEREPRTPQIGEGEGSHRFETGSRRESKGDVKGLKEAAEEDVRIVSSPTQGGAVVV